MKLPIRPTSNTDFYWVGRPGGVKFEVSDSGEVVAMLTYQDQASEAERAEKVR